MSKSKLHFENKWISPNRWNTEINATYHTYFVRPIRFQWCLLYYLTWIWSNKYTCTVCMYVRIGLYVQVRAWMLSWSGAALTSGWSPSAGQSSNRRHSPIWSTGRWAETGWSDWSYLEEIHTRREEEEEEEEEKKSTTWSTTDIL